MDPFLKTMFEGALGGLTFGMYWYYVMMRDMRIYHKQIEDEAKLKEYLRNTKEINNKNVHKQTYTPK